MAERKQAIQLKFYVTEQERTLIEEKMKLLQTDNLGAYLRKMPIDGYIIQLDYSAVKEQTTEIQKVGVNVNQIARWVDYICNPDKTDNQILISSYGCSYQTADIEFGFTLSKIRDKGDNLGHHLIQSFAPGEVSYEEAHRIGKELADKVLGGRYEYVLTTHIDKGHIHNHIIFCAVNFATHCKYVSNKKSYYQIRGVSDRLCREHGLSVVTPGQERFTRSKTLGEAYTVEAITERIAGTYRAKPKALRQKKAGISMLIDIQNSIKAAESKGYEQWAKIHNLKQAAKTLNFLTEHDISEY